MKEYLKKIVKDALIQMNIDKDIDEIIIEIPKDNKNGDFSSNIAMQLSKDMKTNPSVIAGQIIELLNKEKIKQIVIAGPGFINFFVKNDYLFDNLNKILEELDDYGKLTMGSNQKVNIEFVSANPTGFLHLGHARGAAYGSSLANLLSFAGYDVTKEYYINDAGNQINNLEESIKARYRRLCGEPENMPENGYHGKEIIKIAEEIYNEYKKEAKEAVFKEKGLAFLLNNIKNDLENFRVTFDIWTSEKSLYENKMVETTLHKLKDSGYTYRSDDALWLKTTAFGDEKDRVLIKQDQTNTYLLPDIAYHLDKYRRGYDKLINVFGADHHGYIPRLKAGIKIMGEDPDKLQVEIIQMVRLVRGDEEIKMSKRTGNAVTINDLVEEVGLDATRYFFAMRSIDTQMDFDLELATKKTNENPVYYVQYAYARINSIIKEYNKSVKKLDVYQTLNSEYTYNILVKLNSFQDIIEQSALKYEPHLITNYIYDLAHLFHVFYAHERVLGNEELYTLERINLIKAVAQVIKNALSIIGVEAKEKM